MVLQYLYNSQKIKFSINDFFSKCHQIRGFLRIWSHLLKKSLMENFILRAVLVIQRILSFLNLAEFSPMSHFYTPWKRLGKYQGSVTFIGFIDSG